MLNLNDEASAYYSNNRVKKFYKKPLSGKFNNSSVKKPMLNFGGNLKGVERRRRNKKRRRLRISLKGILVIIATIVTDKIILLMTAC